MKRNPFRRKKLHLRRKCKQKNRRQRMFLIEEELKKLPAKPGVYIMHGEKDEIIYVGKAVSLKNRVRQYFQSSRNKGVKIEQMVTHITRFEYIITDSELEALVLESNLIKEHRPKYNTMLKDDKSYPFIKVTVQEAYPRVLFARRMKKDKNRYFGPYTSAGAVKAVIELVRKLYQVRSCSRTLPRDCKKDRPCLYYHMKQCAGPCTGEVSQEDYRENIQKVLRFLNGDFQDTVSQLTEKMQKASEEMRFEDAAECRDLIQSIQKIGERQKITAYGEEDRDIIAVAMDESLDLREQDAVVQIFFMRSGKMIGRDHYYLRVVKGDTREQVLSSFLKQFYAGTPFIPREIMLQTDVEDREIIEEWLSTRRRQKVHILVPKKGSKEKLVELALENAKMVLDKDRERMKREEGRTIGAVREVEQWLGLKDIVRMEAFDISNISGFESVGSMVVYEKGRPKKSDYRKFRIKSVQGPNDYASMEEVLTRRFTHESTGEFDSFARMPDLLLMDGGRGQVNIALGVLEKLGVEIPVCGMVKDDHHRTRGLYFNNIEIPIDTNSEGFRLITRIQDEAHRFAIEYHRSLRSKEQVHSVLDDIPGIGERRRKALMRKFRSIEKIREASEEELAETESMNLGSARQVYLFFHPPAKNQESQ
ncbi:excinuclease ABC subunit UvrC [Blautia glucerasea]